MTKFWVRMFIALVAFIVGLGQQAKAALETWSPTSSAGSNVSAVIGDGISLVDKGLTNAQIIWLTIAAIAVLGTVIGFLRRRK